MQRGWSKLSSMETIHSSRLVSLKMCSTGYLHQNQNLMITQSPGLYPWHAGLGVRGERGQWICFLLWWWRSFWRQTTNLVYPEEAAGKKQQGMMQRGSQIRAGFKSQPSYFLAVKPCGSLSEPQVFPPWGWRELQSVGCSAPSCNNTSKPWLFSTTELRNVTAPHKI